MELLRIQNFAGIKEMAFEFKSISILIGPQGSGKSVSVKLLYFCKRYVSGIIESIMSGEDQQEYDKQQKEKFISYFPRESWPKEKFNIIYSFDEIELRISKYKNSVTLASSKALKTAVEHLRAIYNEEKRATIGENKLSSFHPRLDAERKLNKLNSYFDEKFSRVVRYNQYFIPAGRSFFANIQKSIFSFLSDNRSLDHFLIEFGSFYENLKSFYDDILDEDNPNILDSTVSLILNGNYQREKDKDYLVHADDRKVNLSNASSGQQETLPLMVILKVLNRGYFVNPGATVYIEEPEAHLFPVAQKRMVQLLAKVFNNSRSRVQIIVTTHSPYILASFNNLLEAGHLSHIKPEQAEKIAGIVPREEQIDPDLFCAYSLQDGHMQNLVDEESKLISPTILDSISNEIAKEFGELLDIEF